MRSPSWRATTSVPKRAGGARPARCASAWTAAATSARPSCSTRIRSNVATLIRPPGASTGAVAVRAARLSSAGCSWAPVRRRSPWKAPSTNGATSPASATERCSAWFQPPSAGGAACAAGAPASGSRRVGRRSRAARIMVVIGAPARALEWRSGRGPIIGGRMTLTDTVKQDLAGAMKAGEKERVSTLRLVLSELQKAAKDGNTDEQAVLRRERKRRLESAGAFRDGGRPELARAEEAEAVIIEGYLPAELGDDELRGMVADALAETGATSPRDMGKVMKAAMQSVAGRADGKRVSALVQEALRP